jgi:hypothetical protein
MAGLLGCERDDVEGDPPVLPGVQRSATRQL